MEGSRLMGCRRNTQMFLAVSSFTAFAGVNREKMPRSRAQTAHTCTRGRPAMPTRFRMAHKLWLAVVSAVVLLLFVLGFPGCRLDRAQARADAMASDMASRVQAAMRWPGLVEVNVARTQILSVISDPQAEAQFKDVMLATSAQIGAVQKY